ncbi:MAG: hypothetical protein ACYTBJ_15060 [Planctomycetota bacterium]|jgi:hypothetical protein
MPIVYGAFWLLMAVVFWWIGSDVEALICVAISQIHVLVGDIKKRDSEVSDDD